MARAVLIAGNEQRFLREITCFREMLLTKTYVTQATILRTAYDTPADFRRKLSAALRKTHQEPLLLVFSGHGCSFGWGLSGNLLFDYSQLIPMLLDRYPAPFLLLNDCCYAAGVTECLDRSAVAVTSAGVIAACRRGETTEGGLLWRITLDWGRMTAFDPDRYTVEYVEPVKEPTTTERAAQSAITMLGFGYQARREYPAIRWGATNDSLFVPLK